jgi:hypothetical protein
LKQVNIYNLNKKVKKLEENLKKYYIAHCVTNKKKELVKEFFDEYADELSKLKEWREWFSKENFKFK